nr:hypothetical protein [Sneathiella glossodoripedis]
MDELTVKVERDPQSATSEATSKELQHKIKSILGVTAKVVICEPGKLERSGGKAKRVIDHRKL